MGEGREGESFRPLEKGSPQDPFVFWPFPFRGRRGQRDPANESWEIPRLRQRRASLTPGTAIIVGRRLLKVVAPVAVRDVSQPPPLDGTGVARGSGIWIPLRPTVGRREPVKPGHCKWL